jgi:hypothetical protein
MAYFGYEMVSLGNIVSILFKGGERFYAAGLTGRIQARVSGKNRPDGNRRKQLQSRPVSRVGDVSRFVRQAIVKQDRCFLVEGYTDVISMHLLSNYANLQSNYATI